MVKEPNQLGAALRRRRDRLGPADVGLPVAGRRRAPGLKMARRGSADLDQLGARMSSEQRTRYGSLILALPSHVAAFTRAGVTSGAAARTIAKATTDRRPRTRYTVGRTAAFLAAVPRFLPDRVLDRMTTSDLRKHHPHPA